MILKKMMLQTVWVSICFAAAVVCTLQHTKRIDAMPIESEEYLQTAAVHVIGGELDEKLMTIFTDNRMDLSGSTYIYNFHEEKVGVYYKLKPKGYFVYDIPSNGEKSYAGEADVLEKAIADILWQEKKLYLHEGMFYEKAADEQMGYQHLTWDFYSGKEEQPRIDADSLAVPGIWGLAAVILLSIKRKKKR